ncbi:DUF3175 domain-containing protein [Ensifer sp. IC3342]|nr:DUF3175 domain-containing protein [Ensifer sp. BRP08]MCA1448127.1 DUF3175 domain-containing protein [Ensifer sp. IC3342]
MSKKSTKKKWSQDVTEKSDALDIEEGIFKSEDPAKIAHSLKRSAEASDRRKSSPFRSAMSMLTFYINRAGAGLSKKQKHVLEEAKVELRKDFGRQPK